MARCPFWVSRRGGTPVKKCVCREDEAQSERASFQVSPMLTVAGSGGGRQKDFPGERRSEENGCFIDPEVIRFWGFSEGRRCRGGREGL